MYKWAPYVPVAQRRRQATDALARLAKSGQKANPVILSGRAIATTSWGKAWCANLERYSDYDNRLPRGRSYVRNGAVLDLQIAPGQVKARVMGSSVYTTRITVQPLPKPHWQQLCTECAGGIDSLVELLQGRLSKSVMDRLCRQGDGLFPSAQHIRFDCTCPDGAMMCKHVAAALYGIGARIDHQPELLFTLRHVDPADLLAKVGSGVAAAPVASRRALADDDLSALFGLDLNLAPRAVSASPHKPVPTTATPASGKAAGKSQAKTSTTTRAPHGRSSESRKASAITQGRARAPRRGKSATSVMAPSANQPPTKTPAKPRDPITHLLMALQRTGWLDNAAGRAATGLDAIAVLRLLKQLVVDGHAQVEGQGRTTRYVSMGPRKRRG